MIVLEDAKAASVKVSRAKLKVSALMMQNTHGLSSAEMANLDVQCELARRELHRAEIEYNKALDIWETCNHD